MGFQTDIANGLIGKTEKHMGLLIQPNLNTKTCVYQLEARKMEPPTTASSTQSFISQKSILLMLVLYSRKCEKFTFQNLQPSIINIRTIREPI